MNAIKKIQRLETLIDRLENGRRVSKSDLRPVIGETGLAEIDSKWSEEMEQRRFRPSQIVEYSDRLNKALSLAGIEHRLSVKGDAYKAKKAGYRAAAALESALVYLTEVVQSDPDLSMWVDRRLEEATICDVGLPRPIWSRFALNRGKIDWPLRRTKRDVIRNVLVGHLEELQQETGTFENPPIVIPESTFSRRLRKAESTR